MATLKTCLAVVDGFTADDFAALEARAQDYAKGKALTNEHFIKAAKDAIATLKSDVAAIEAGVEPEAAPEQKVDTSPEPVQETPKTEQVDNKDLTKNAPPDRGDLKERVERAFAKLKDKLGDRLLVTDESLIESAMEQGDYEAARVLMKEIVDLMKARRYRTPEGKKPPSKPIERSVLDALIAKANKILGDNRIVVKDDVTDVFPEEEPGSRAGALDDGVVYLFRSGIPDGVDGEKTILHELFHKGLRNLFPTAEYLRMLDRMYDNSRELRSLANTWMENNKADVKRETDKYASEAQKAVAARTLAVEEVLAGKAESLDTLSPSTLRQIGNWVADIADKLGMTKLAQWLRTAGRSPLEQFLQEALRASSKGMPSGTSFRPDIRFRTAEAAVKEMASTFSISGKGMVRRGVLSSSFLRDLGSRFGDKLKGVTDYVDNTFKMSAAAADIQEKATEVVDAIQALPVKDRAQLMEFMADATAANVVVEPTAERNNDHLSTVTKNANGTTTRVYDPVVAEMQAKFARLSNAQKAAYRRARQVLADNWKKRGELLARAANDVYNPLIEDAKRVGDQKKVVEFERERRGFIADTNARLSEIKGDYFPMMRFGEWVVTRKSAEYETLANEVDEAHAALNALYDKYEKHTPEQRKAIAELNKKRKARGEEVIGEYTEEEADQIKAARQAYNQLQGRLEAMKSNESDYYVAQFESEGEAVSHADAVKGKVSLKRENLRELNPISRTMLTRLEESMAASMQARGDVTALRDAKRAMYQVFLSTLPERSALMRQVKRKNVAGFSRDMERAISSSMLKDSFYLSRMEFSDKINEALNTAYKDAQEKGDTQLQEVHNELARRQAASMRYVDTPIQDQLAAITYIYKLGVSPGYLIANMIQPFTVSVPMMWARHGMKTTKAFSKAYADTAKMVAASLKANYKRGEINFKDVGLAKDEEAMLNEMLRQRLLSITMVADLARTADGKGINSFASMMAKPSHFVEVVNRMSTALAAYRMEKVKSGEKAATDYAMRVLTDTHFDYSTENAPYWMKPGVVPMSKVLFQFKKYQAGMLSMFAKAAAAMASNDKVAKKEAMAQLTGVMATHFAIGGVFGLPAAGAMLTLATLIGNAFGDDEPWDARVALRNWAYDTFGKDAGDVVAKGLPTLIGVDLSQKAGLGDIVSPLPTLRADKSGRDLALEVLASGAGPFIGGIVPQFFEAMSYFSKGDFIKGAEQMIPKWAADPIKAARFSTEGITTKQGTTALSPDEISAWQAFLQASGVPASAITDSYEARAAQQNVKTELGAGASAYKKDWLEARKSGDFAEAEQIWVKIRDEVNPVRKRNGLQPITKGELLRFQQERGKAESRYAKFGADTNPQLAELGRFARQ